MRLELTTQLSGLVTLVDLFTLCQEMVRPPRAEIALLQQDRVSASLHP